MRKTCTQETNALKLQPTPQSGRFTKKIGGTTYQVSYYFSQTSHENFNDKIIRLLKNEVLSQ